MKSLTPKSSRRPRQQGFALLLVVFMATLLLLATIAVAPNMLTLGKREKEKEMIWRGKQYVRGVKLYYRKMGRFPTSLDDLTKPKLGSIRFMRQAYKDPMNKQDGSWRLIYVGPSGQLIGSLKPHPLNLQLPQAGGVGVPPNPQAGSGLSSLINGSAPSGQPGQPGQPGPPGTQPGPGGSSSGTTPTGTTGAPVGTDQTDSGNTAQPAPLSDSPIIGGNIIGVGSKIDKPSIIIYDKAKKYLLYEFVWDPSKDVMAVGQGGLQTGTGLGQPVGQPLGQSPFGKQPGQTPNNPQNPQQNPPQNPQQPQNQQP